MCTNYHNWKPFDRESLEEKPHTFLVKSPLVCFSLCVVFFSREHQYRAEMFVILQSEIMNLDLQSYTVFFFFFLILWTRLL